MDAPAREMEAVLGVFAALVRPLMPVAFEYGLSAKEISDATRRSYIQALETRLAAQSRPTTDARIALIAQLARSEVTALRDAERSSRSNAKDSSARLDQVTSLLSVWHTHPKFSGAYGLALDLDLEPTPGSPRRSLTEIIEVSCPGADRDGILDELIAVGSAEIVDGRTLRCRSRAAVMRGAEVSVSRIERTARFLEAAAATFAHNLLLEDSPAYFERMLVSDGPLSEKERDEFMRLTTERGEEFILDLDTSLSKVATGSGATKGKRYGVGVYFFEERSAFLEPRSTGSTVPGEAHSRPSPQREIDVLAPPRRGD
jgi:hypothetical protein